MDALSPGSDTGLNGSQRLQNLEHIIIEAAEVIKREANSIALALLAIQTDALWRYARDDDSRYFTSFERYLNQLADRVGVARSTLFDYKSTARLAIANGLVDTPEQYIEANGVSYFRTLKNEIVDCDPFTGEIIGIKGRIDIEDPVAFTQNIIGQVDVSLPPRERLLLMKQLVHPEGKLIEVKLYLTEGENDGLKVRFVIENGLVNPQVGFIEDGLPPQLVLDELRRRQIYLSKEQ